MPILYLVTRDHHEDDEQCGIYDHHFWLLTKADALKHAKKESERWGVGAEVHRVNVPTTKRGIFIALRLDDAGSLAEFLGRDKVQRVAQFHSGSRLDRKTATSDLQRAVEQARALIREEGGA